MLWADVTDPYTKSLEAEFLNRQVQVEAVITVFKEHGFGVTNYYSDGVVRMAEGDGKNDLCCFVRPDGAIGRMMTRASMVAVAGLRP